MVNMTGEQNSRSSVTTKAYVFAFIALVLISFTSMASYFAYDEIGALQPRLESEMDFSATKVLALYSAYSIAVIFFVVIGGVLVDILGVTKSAIIWSFLIAVGTFMVFTQDYTVMFIGRILFGLACEAFYVVQNKIISKWFKKKLLATAFGVNLFITRLGTVAAFGLIPWIADKTSTKIALLIVAGTTIIGIITTIIYAILDRIGVENKYVDFEEAVDSDEEKVKISEIFLLPKAFWVISILCMVFYGAIFPFTSFSTDFFMEKFKLSNDVAGNISSLVALIAMIATPFFGYAIDRWGKRATMMIIGSAALIPCHIAFGFTEINPRLLMIVLGFAFSLVPAALWPAVPRIVKDKQLGTAYGVIAMVQNIGLFLFPLAVGAIRDKFGSYQRVFLMFAALGIIGVAAGVWLKVIEKKGGGYLEKA